MAYIYIMVNCVIWDLTSRSRARVLLNSQEGRNSQRGCYAARAAQMSQKMYFYRSYIVWL